MIKKENLDIVSIIQEDIYCDKCGAKLVQNPTMVFTTFPPQYQYHCEKCDNYSNNTEVYPKIVITFSNGRQKYLYG